MRKPALAVAATAAALLFLSFATPAQAITDGVPDGDGHPNVGLMVAFDDEGAPQWRCSGTLISPTVYLTAGHCTFGADRVQIWFGDDVRPAAAPGYPLTGGDVWGTPVTHPQYEDEAFYLYDLGVVVLDTAVTGVEYAQLPELNQLDVLATQRGKQDVTFTAVGYGLQKSFPDSIAATKNQRDRVRMVSHPKLNQINTGFTGDGSLLLSNNAHTGGTCSGDSGGPTFIGDSDVLAGVTSFGLNVTCAGTGGVYRVDRADDLEWIAGFVG